MRNSRLCWKKPGKTLPALEYRGYDSAGICIAGETGLKSCKAKGRLSELVEKSKNMDLSGTTGIGHTRWATHGAPTEYNAHPHFSNDGNFAIVHNGIIENYLDLKAFLAEKGFTFASDTDTEVIPQLMQYYYNGNVFDTFLTVVSKLEGAYALGLVSTYEPNTLYATRKDSPLIAGLGKGENYIASDIPAILSETKDVYLLEQGEFAIVTADEIKIVDQDKNPIDKKIFEVNWDVSAAEKEGYDFFMMKEIMEQPKAILDTIHPRIKGDEIVLDELSLDKSYFKGLNKVHIIACGSAYHVGLVGKNIIEGIARVDTQVDLASEFRYRNPVINDGDLAIIISQSGETADTLAALREANARGARTLAIVNVVGSAISKAAHDVIYTCAGPEIAVATTKAYSTQLAVIYLLAMYIGEKLGTLAPECYAAMLEGLQRLPDQVAQILVPENLAKIEEAAEAFSHNHDVFFIGRNLDSATCLEGSLKLKEIAYVHSEAYPAGELKHGPISLIEEETLVVALATVEKLFDKTMANVREVKARGAHVLGVTTEDFAGEIEKYVDRSLIVPKTHPLLQPSLTVIPLQAFAYYIALARGCDVDMPRNLAKSVTVE